MRADRDAGPLIVGVGGTVRPNSSSEKALRACLAAAEAEGARTRCFGGSALLMPMYDPVDPARTVAARELVDALRQADGVIVASPGYHGSVSGLVKNALDYIEDLRDDRRVYLDGRPVGLITCALGAQANGTTLNTLRSIVHALRGWPAPMGVTINSGRPAFDIDGNVTDEVVGDQLALLANQVVDAARRGKQPLTAAVHD
jgi:FMN reductase